MMINHIEIEAEFTKDNEKFTAKGILSRRRKGAYFKLPNGQSLKISWLRIAGGNRAKHQRTGYVVKGISGRDVRYGRLK